MIYLDTCLLIYAFEDPQGRGAVVRDAINEQGDREFAISGLVVMECLVGPIKRQDVASRSQYDRYLAEFVPLPIDRPVFVDAAELRAHHGLKTPDALHLAAALSGGCAALWTNDHRFARAAGSFAVTIA